MESKSVDWREVDGIAEELPSMKLLMVIDLNLTPPEMKLFMVILNFEILYGQCKRNTKTLSEDCHMAENTIVRAKRGLVKKGLIKIKKEISPLNGKDGDVINTYMTDKKLFKRLSN